MILDEAGTYDDDMSTIFFALTFETLFTFEQL